MCAAPCSSAFFKILCRASKSHFLSHQSVISSSPDEAILHPLTSQKIWNESIIFSDNSAAIVSSLFNVSVFESSFARFKMVFTNHSIFSKSACILSRNVILFSLGISIYRISFVIRTEVIGVLSWCEISAISRSVSFLFFSSS